MSALSGGAIGAIAAVGACCGIPLAIGAGAMLLGRGKKHPQKAGNAAAQKRSAADACCSTEVSIAKSGIAFLAGRKKREAKGAPPVAREQPRSPAAPTRQS